MINRLGLRIKLLLTDRTAVVTYIVCAIIMALFLGSLNLHAEERSSVPVGLICEDRSDKAQRLKNEICGLEALYVYEGDFEYLEGLLFDGYITCIFVINEGYGERIEAGSVKELITVYSAAEDKTPVILSDIVAGSMLYDICFEKSLNMYLELENPVLSGEEYREYSLSLAENPQFEYSFEIDYREPVTGDSETTITNGIIYRQMIAGMLAMLMSLLAFTGFNGIGAEHQKGIRKRIKLSGGCRPLRSLGECLAVTLYLMPLIVLTAVFFGSPGIFLVNLLFVMIMSLIFYCAAALFRTTAAYQLAGAVIVILFGAAGFVSVFSGMTGIESLEALNILPNSMYIEYFCRFLR